MKLQKINRHEKDKLVKLDDDYNINHIYLIREVPHKLLGFDSVTTYLKELSPVFNPNIIIDRWLLNNDSRLEGRSKEQIIKDWNSKGKEAARLGTYMHEQFELYFNDEDYDSSISEFYNFIDWKRTYNIIPYRTEMTVFSDKFKLVGNIDLITDNGDGTYDIWDYKRTYEIKDNAYNKHFNYPISSLPCSDKNKYALQLSIYKYLLEEVYGFKIKNIYNIAIKDNKCLIIKQKYLFEEVIRVLNVRIDSNV